MIQPVARADSSWQLMTMSTNETSWTDKLWIYDLRTNKHFTLKTNPLKYEDLKDFIQCYNPENRRERTETDRFHAFNCEELVKRDKGSLDIFWLKGGHQASCLW